MRTRSEFLFVQKGARASRGALSVEARRRADAGAIRFGVTASRKVGGAVVRNRAKRRLREVARALLPQHGAAGVDYVLVARTAAASAPFARLLDDAQNALLRLQSQIPATLPPAATTDGKD